MKNKYININIFKCADALRNRKVKRFVYTFKRYMHASVSSQVRARARVCVIKISSLRFLQCLENFLFSE